MKKMLSLILALVLVVGMMPAVSAGKNPDTGAKVEPSDSWKEYIGYHRYVALGREITIELDYDMGNKGWVIPTWKLYKTKLTGKESPEELAKTGESLVRNKKSAIDSYGGWVYNFPVSITVDETFDADELGVGTYLMVGYMAYENQTNHSVTNDYKTLCAIAIHVVEKEKPIESIRYYLCKKDGTTIRELSVGEELTLYISWSGNDKDPSYLKVEPYPANATEYIQRINSIDQVKPGAHTLSYSHPMGENFFMIDGETCGSGKMKVCIRDYADGSEPREIENIFSVTVPHERFGEVKTLIKPNCTEEGLRGAWCDGRSEGCDYIFDKKVLAPYGHSLTDSTKQILSDPTASKPGKAVGQCGRCWATDVEVPIPAIFSDVNPAAFYSDALDHGYTAGWVTGITPSTFEPNTECTRGQVVTFLWRAAGSPEPETAVNPFTDVTEGKYYYKAVLWAVENGITDGMTPTSFQPDGQCTRAQVVTFLHRAMGKPDPQQTQHPFTDVIEDKFYYNAMLWAVENGITTGMTSTTFVPDNPCTRGQVVTFLYRTYNK